MAHERYFILSSLLFLISLFSLQLAAEASAEESVTVITADQTKLNCAYYPPSTPNAPAIILLPDTRCNGNNFGSIPKKFNEAGFGVLAMDFRYKDIIFRAGDIKEQISTIQKQDLTKLVDFDTKSGIDYLLSKKEIDPKRIVLLGTSLGSRVALISGIKYNCNALVLVSLSGEDALPGYKPVKDLLSDYGEKPILFISAEKDWGGNFKAAEYNKLYYDWKTGKKELKIWPGSGHGVDLNQKEEGTNLVINFLKAG
jgi:dienelactone hydrolase